MKYKIHVNMFSAAVLNVLYILSNVKCLENVFFAASINAHKIECVDIQLIQTDSFNRYTIKCPSGLYMLYIFLNSQYLKLNTH